MSHLPNCLKGNSELQGGKRKRGQRPPSSVRNSHTSHRRADHGQPVNRRLQRETTGSIPKECTCLPTRIRCLWGSPEMFGDTEGPVSPAGNKTGEMAMLLSRYRANRHSCPQTGDTQEVSNNTNKFKNSKGNYKTKI